MFRLVALLSYVFVLFMITPLTYADSCPYLDCGGCNSGYWGKIHGNEDLIRSYQSEGGLIGGQINACWSSYTNVKNISDQANRVAGEAKSKPDLLREQKNQLSTFQNQQRTFSNYLNYSRQALEATLPLVISSVQDYISSNQDTLNATLNSLQQQVNSTNDNQLKIQLQMEIEILSDLSVTQERSGLSKNDILSLLKKVTQGSESDRANALSQFTPMTRAVAQAVYSAQNVSLTGEAAFEAVRRQATENEAWTQTQLQLIDAKINEADQNVRNLEAIATNRTQEVNNQYSQCRALQDRQTNLPNMISESERTIRDTRAWLDGDGCKNSGQCEWKEHHCGGSNAGERGCTGRNCLPQ
jgi:outer membrane murein-binding lipoprotein Lpp